MRIDGGLTGNVSTDAIFDMNTYIIIAYLGGAIVAIILRILSNNLLKYLGWIIGSSVITVSFRHMLKCGVSLDLACIPVM